MKIANYYMDAIQTMAGATSKNNALYGLDAIHREAGGDAELTGEQYFQLVGWITETKRILEATGALDLLDK